MVIIDSIRDRHSRGELACSVPIEPSWPVFIACSRSNASGPRTSPTMIRSGRIRRQFLTRSRIVTWPSPSRLGGRVSRRTTCGCWSCSSAASSQVMTRSSWSMIVGQAVEQRGLARAGAARDDDVAADAADDLEDLGALGADRAEADELVESELVLLELADGERRPVDRQRRRDDVDARAVRQARVADRAEIHRRGGRPG